MTLIIRFDFVMRFTYQICIIKDKSPQRTKQFLKKNEKEEQEKFCFSSYFISKLAAKGATAYIYKPDLPINLSGFEVLLSGC